MRGPALVLFLAVLSGSAAAKSPDESALDAFSTDWREAYQAGDFDRLRDLYEPDAWLMTRDQPARKGRDAILAYFKASRAPDSEARIAFEAEDVVIDPPYAFKIARWRLESPRAISEPFRDAGRSLVIFKKGADGRWRLWRDIDNRTPDAPREGWTLSESGGKP